MEWIKYPESNLFSPLDVFRGDCIAARAVFSDVIFTSWSVQVFVFLCPSKFDQRKANFVILDAAQLAMFWPLNHWSSWLIRQKERKIQKWQATKMLFHFANRVEICHFIAKCLSFHFIFLTKPVDLWYVWYELLRVNSLFAFAYLASTVTLEMHCLWSQEF